MQASQLPAPKRKPVDADSSTEDQEGPHKHQRKNELGANAKTSTESTDAAANSTEMIRSLSVRFGIHPLSKYRARCPQFSEPKEITSFSYNEKRQVCMDDRELKYYFPPRLDPSPCLFAGFEKQIRRDHQVNEHIDGLLTALAHLRQRNGAGLQAATADFVMYRGMLTRIFVTPYNTRDSWAMNATRVGNTIYIEDNVTPEAIAGRMSSSEKHQMLMYSGYKFETLCVIDKPPSQLDGSSDPALASRLDTIVDTHSEYCSVFRTRLGSHSIISGAEVDCIDREKPHEFPNRYYRELKTTGLLDSPRKVEMFERHKLIKFWAQSFIAGIPRVTVGYRDSDGTLRQIEEINTMEMPRRVRNKPRMWEASVCMNFADMVLQKIKDCVVDEGPETQYRISFDSASQEIEIAPLGKCKPFMTKEYIAVASAKK